MILYQSQKKFFLDFIVLGETMLETPHFHIPVGSTSAKGYAASTQNFINLISI